MAETKRVFLKVPENGDKRNEMVRHLSGTIQEVPVKQGGWAVEVEGYSVLFSFAPKRERMNLGGVGDLEVFQPARWTLL